MEFITNQKTDTPIMDEAARKEYEHFNIQHLYDLTKNIKKADEVLKEYTKYEYVDIVHFGIESYNGIPMAEMSEDEFDNAVSDIVKIAVDNLEILNSAIFVDSYGRSLEITWNLPFPLYIGDASDKIFLHNLECYLRQYLSIEADWSSFSWVSDETVNGYDYFFDNVYVPKIISEIFGLVPVLQLDKKKKK